MPSFSIDMSSNPFIRTLSEKDCIYLHDKISHTRFLVNDSRKITLAVSKLYDVGKTMVGIISILMDHMTFSRASIEIDDVQHRVDMMLDLYDIDDACKQSEMKSQEFSTFKIHIEYMQQQAMNRPYREDLYVGKFVITIMNRNVPIGRMTYEQNEHDIMTYDMNFPEPSQLLADILQSIMSVF